MGGEGGRGREREKWRERESESERASARERERARGRKRENKEGKEGRERKSEGGQRRRKKTSEEDTARETKRRQNESRNERRHLFWGGCGGAKAQNHKGSGLRGSVCVVVGPEPAPYPPTLFQIYYSNVLEKCKPHPIYFASHELLFSPVVPEVVTEVPERVEEEPAPPARVEPAKQQVTEEDLEDWLDSMIS